MNSPKNKITAPSLSRCLIYGILHARAEHSTVPRSVKTESQHFLFSETDAGHELERQKLIQCTPFQGEGQLLKISCLKNFSFQTRRLAF
jgi:hypothetical protein